MVKTGLMLNMQGNFHAFFHLLTFFKITCNFFNEFFKEH